MSIIFAGTPPIAADCLRELLVAGPEKLGGEITAVLTRPDAPVGRRRTLTPSPVAQAAEEAGLPVIRADKVDDEVAAQLKEHSPQLGIVVAYGALLPQHALDVPGRGWVNLHYSALPKHRGAAPVQHALLNGETATAATIFQLEKGMDAGPVHASAEHPIDEGVSAGQLLQDLTSLGTKLLLDLTPKLLAGTSAPAPQQGEPSFAPKLTRDDACIDPARPAAEVMHRTNATIPEPGAWTWIGEQRIKLGPVRLFRGELPDDAEPGQVVTADEHGTRLPVLVTGQSSGVVLTEVQPAGKRMTPAADWLRGQQQTPVLGGHHD
ncbi:methionyl-tRNA formyltransferase [Nesterenkonia populi]|uniref:methionyl-tRNA formyltransferase n=1 Tax=Nesterenkonia populi TaxID=1591087 RepID=UPI0011BDBF51|nr:methionyl-tRNA formyltransferase [Nesterenkonia populi]